MCFITMEENSGWATLLKLTCEDILDKAEGDDVLLRYQLVRKMVAYYRVYQLWSKSWPLLRLVGEYRKSTNSEVIREKLIPSIKDCLQSVRGLYTMSQAREASIKLSQLATPAYIRVSDSEGRLVNYREPVFEPIRDRNKEMTEIIFQCIQDLEIPLRFDTSLTQLY